MNLARQARQTTVKTSPQTRISMYAFTEELDAIRDNSRKRIVEI